MSIRAPGAAHWARGPLPESHAPMQTMHTASALLDSGQASVNLVAAIPSLHAATTAAIAAFLWNRVHRGWRPFLAAYVLVMAFTLVYTAEHYVIDILLGWALAAVALLAVNRTKSRRAGPSSEMVDVQPGQTVDS